PLLHANAGGAEVRGSLLLRRARSAARLDELLAAGGRGDRPSRGRAEAGAGRDRSGQWDHQGGQSDERDHPGCVPRQSAGPREAEHERPVADGRARGHPARVCDCARQRRERRGRRERVVHGKSGTRADGQGNQDRGRVQTRATQLAAHVQGGAATLGVHLAGGRLLFPALGATEEALRRREAEALQGRARGVAANPELPGSRDDGFISDLLGNQRRNRQGYANSPNQFVPLEFQVGKRWRAQLEVTDPQGVTWHAEQELRIVARERVTVPAGSFNAFRLEARGTSSPPQGPTESQVTRWHIPDFQWPVARDEVRRRGGKEVFTERLEMLSYKLA